MDCIAGRKNTGKLTGDIRINGHPQEFPAFSRLVRALCSPSLARKLSARLGCGRLSQADNGCWWCL